jgi:L-ascorbate metabolism protein UlaG (beta-lactamase superfamily)
MNKTVIFLFLLLSNIIFQPCFGQEKIDVTYIANSGFLIESNSKKILIDVLFKNGWNSYLIPTDSTVSKIINQQAPFENTNLMLITHNHEDHFNDSMVVAYLNNNSENVLIAPPLVTNAILKNPGYKNKNQIVELDKINREKNVIAINGIRVKSFFLQHDTRPQIENFGYLIDIDGLKVFHTGDYNGAEIVEFGKLELQKENIDLALLNFYGFWSTKEERAFTEEYIHPKKIALMHIPPAEIETVKDSVKRINDFVDITVFESSMKKKSF